MVRVGLVVATFFGIVGCGREPTPYTPPEIPQRETVSLPGFGDCVILDDDELRQLGVQVNRFSEFGVFKGNLRSDLSDYTVRQVVLRLKAMGWPAPRDFTVRVTAYPISVGKLSINGGQSGLQLDGPVKIVAGWATPGGEPGAPNVVQTARGWEHPVAPKPQKKANSTPTTGWNPQPVLSTGSEIPATFSGANR